MRKNRVAGVALVSLAMLLTACGGDADGQDEGTPEPAGTTPAETEAATEEAGTEGAEEDLFAQLPPEIQERGTIVFAGDSHPPYRTVGDDGTVTGIDADF